MRRHPVIRNLAACGKPDIIVAPREIEETAQRLDPAGPAGQPAMKADRHHLRRAVAPLAIQLRERRLQVVEKLVPGIEALRRRKAHVVAIQRVGHDQLIAGPDPVPVGKVVGIGIGQPVEARLGSQPDRVHAGAALVETAWWRADNLRVQADRLGYVGALLGLGDILVIDPFQPVAGDVPPRRIHRRHLPRAARQCGRHAEHCHRPVGQQPVKPPEPGPRPVFVDRFHVPVPLAGPGRCAHDLGQERLRGRVAVQDVVLAALFVVDDDLDGDPRPARPGRVRRGRTKAGHVSWIACHFPPRRSSAPFASRSGVFQSISDVAIPAGPFHGGSGMHKLRVSRTKDRSWTDF